MPRRVPPRTSACAPRAPGTVGSPSPYPPTHTTNLPTNRTNFTVPPTQYTPLSAGRGIRKTKQYLFTSLGVRGLRRPPSQDSRTHAQRPRHHRNPGHHRENQNGTRRLRLVPDRSDRCQKATHPPREEQPVPICGRVRRQGRRGALPGLLPACIDGGGEGGKNGAGPRRGNRG